MPRTCLHVVSCADAMSRTRLHVASCANVRSRGRPRVFSCADVMSRARPRVFSCADVMPRARLHVTSCATRFAAMCLAVTATASMAGSSQHGSPRHTICIASALTCGAPSQRCRWPTTERHAPRKSSPLCPCPHVRSALAPRAREPRVTAPNNPRIPGCALAHGKSVNVSVEAHTRPERTIGETRKLPIRRQKTAARG